MGFVIAAWFVAVLGAGAWVGYRIGARARRATQVAVFLGAALVGVVFYSAVQDAGEINAVLAARVLLPIMVVLGMLAAQWRNRSAES